MRNSYDDGPVCRHCGEFLVCGYPYRDWYCEDCEAENESHQLMIDQGDAIAEAKENDNLNA